MARRCLLLGLFVFAFTGCFKKPGDSVTPKYSGAGIVISAHYVYANLLTSYLSARAPCEGNARIKLRYRSSLTAQRTIDETCVNDRANFDRIPIDHADQAQNFIIEVCAELRGICTVFKRLKPNRPYDFAYTPEQQALPGFAVTSGGGNVSGTDGLGTTVQAYTTIGEPYSVGAPNPGTQTGTDVLARSGIQGVLDP